MSAFKRILVPVDFSACSDLALQRALELQKAVDGTLEVVHVWESPELGFDAASAVIVGQEASLTEYIRKQADRMLQTLVRDLEMGGARSVTGRLLSGNPANVIVLASKEADLIVIGTHGRRAITRFLLGSVAERVVRHAHCPVLTIRLEG